MNTAWLNSELDRNSLWQMGLWHLTCVRKHRVAPCFRLTVAFGKYWFQGGWLCDRMNTAWLVFELDRNSLCQMGLWHLSWVRKHRVAPCFLP